MEQETLERLIEAIGELQAQSLGHSTMIEAMVMSHPDPRALRAAWHAISAPRIAANATDSATKARSVDEKFAYYFRRWSEKLEQHHPS